MPLDSRLPIDFAVPDGWSMADRFDEAAYTLLRNSDTTLPVASNIVVDGFLLDTDRVDVAALARLRLNELQTQYSVEVLRDDVMDEPTGIRTAQLVSLDYPVGGATVELRQIRIITAIPDLRVSSVVFVLQLQLTCMAEVFDTAGPEFESFVGSIGPYV